MLLLSFTESAGKGNVFFLISKGREKKSGKDYFENEKNIATVYGDRCGSVNIPMLKAFTNDGYKGRSYVVVTRKGMQDFLLVNVLYVYCDGVKNVHYKEFATKKAANNFIEKSIEKAKDNFLKRA